MNRENLAEAAARAADNGSIGNTAAMAVTARPFNDLSARASAGEIRCWDNLQRSRAGATGRQAGCALQPTAAADPYDIDVRQLRTAEGR
jgi:hypothetical protein